MLNVICLNHGTKYSVDYVNRLFNMVQRHLTIPHRFVCFTDNPTNINPKIEIRLLPNNQFKGWWWKPYIFNKDHFPAGDINLFLDLDTVIVKNIDHLITYMPNRFVGLRDVGRVFRPDYRKLGSAVMRWPAGSFSDICEELEKDPAKIKRFHGDQDWIWHLHSKSITFFPDEWIRSYKWEIRSKEELNGLGPRSQFKTVRSPDIPNECSVIAFHGFPQLHTVEDPVIKDNWL